MNNQTPISNNQPILNKPSNKHKQGAKINSSSMRNSNQSISDRYCPTIKYLRPNNSNYIIGLPFKKYFELDYWNSYSNSNKNKLNNEVKYTKTIKDLYKSNEINPDIVYQINPKEWHLYDKAYHESLFESPHLKSPLKPYKTITGIDNPDENFYINVIDYMNNNVLVAGTDNFNIFNNKKDTRHIVEISGAVLSCAFNRKNANQVIYSYRPNVRYSLYNTFSYKDNKICFFDITRCSNIYSQDRLTISKIEQNNGSINNYNNNSNDSNSSNVLYSIDSMNWINNIKPYDENTYAMTCTNGCIFLFDTRLSSMCTSNNTNNSTNPFVSCSFAHVNNSKDISNVICGLSVFNTSIITGGDDNRVVLSDVRKFNANNNVNSGKNNNQAIVKSYKHKSAVRAVDLNSKYIISGGGNYDRTIKVYDLKKDKIVHVLQEESQICSLKIVNHNYIVITYGFYKNNIKIYEIDAEVKLRLKYSSSAFDNIHNNYLTNSRNNNDIDFNSNSNRNIFDNLSSNITSTNVSDENHNRTNTNNSNNNIALDPVNAFIYQFHGHHYRSDFNLALLKESSTENSRCLHSVLDDLETELFTFHVDGTLKFYDISRIVDTEKHKKKFDFIV